MPTTYLLVALLAVLVASAVPVARVVARPWHLFGLVPIAAGIALNVAADRAFRRAATTVKPLGEPSVLVTAGAFRFSRHPMYLGFVLILFGFATLLRGALAFAVPLAFAVFIDRLFVAMEEAKLARRFGLEWEAYAAKTRRWL